MMPPVVGYVNFQQDPHSADPQFLTVKPPPMKGNVGSESKVVNPLVIRPLGPLEHATLFNESAPLSYMLLVRTGSTVGEEVGPAMATEKRAARVMMVDANFIVKMRKLLEVIRECCMRDGLVMRILASSWELLYSKRACAREARQDRKQARQLAGPVQACGRAASQQGSMRCHRALHRPASQEMKVDGKPGECQ